MSKENRFCKSRIRVLVHLQILFSFVCLNSFTRHYAPGEQIALNNFQKQQNDINTSEWRRSPLERGKRSYFFYANAQFISRNRCWLLNRNLVARRVFGFDWTYTCNGFSFAWDVSEMSLQKLMCLIWQKAAATAVNALNIYILIEHKYSFCFHTMNGAPRHSRSPFISYCCNCCCCHMQKMVFVAP